MPKSLEISKGSHNLEGSSPPEAACSPSAPQSIALVPASLPAPCSGDLRSLSCTGLGIPWGQSPCPLCLHLSRAWTRQAQRSNSVGACGMRSTASLTKDSVFYVCPQCRGSGGRWLDLPCSSSLTNHNFGSMTSTWCALFCSLVKWGCS